MSLPLSDIAAVLGCDKGTASKVASGKYGRPNSDLPARYAALVALVGRVREDAARDAARICYSCPREECAGCRVAELI